MTDDNRELLEELTEPNAATATFNTGLLQGRLDQNTHIEMALLLLDMADRVLKRIIEGEVT